jgi:cysteine-rich repeat protein
VEPAGTAQYPAEMEPNDTVLEANPLAAGTSGFTGSICPLADIDIYSFQVTAGGTAVTVKTSDGMGGCPLGAHTYVRLFDANGNVLAQDPGLAGCVTLAPSTYPALSDLAAGTYYVHVESATLFEIASYTLDIDLSTPSCGDGIVQVNAGEQCDHGATNGVGSDGCSATCQILSGTYLFEHEPNNLESMANILPLGDAGFVGQIFPVGDIDWFEFGVSTGDSLVIQVSDGFGNCPEGFDSELTLYGPNMTLIADDKGGGVSPCSLISPKLYPADSNLVAGTYAVELQRISALAQAYYVLSIKVQPPGCGDGIVPEGTKQCDPPTPNPGCSATCMLTGGYTSEVEPNNTLATAQSISGKPGVIASIKPAGDVDYFSFNVPGPTSLAYLAVTDGMGGCPAGFSGTMTLYSPGGTALVSDTVSGPGNCPLINPNLYAQATALTAGTYAAKVALTNPGNTFWEYVLTATVLQPGCGDGVISPGEQCDDGPLNGTAGDGCSATCTSIAPWETELNNTIATANPLWMGFSTWKAEIKPKGDHDYFTFAANAGQTITLVTHDVDKPTYCSSDTYMTLFDSNGNSKVTNDDSGPGPGNPPGGKCSKIVYTVPAGAGGSYSAMVQQYMDMTLIPSYQLDLTVQ